MATERQLFDKPMDILREAFVRNRFGESAVFERPDIETWLAGQREAGRPDDTMWGKLPNLDLCVICEGTSASGVLLTCATSVRTDVPLRSAYESLYACLHDGLYANADGPRIKVRISPSETFVFREESGTLIVERIGDHNRHVCVCAVTDVVFAEWNHHRPRWREAREFLCNALGGGIKRERAKAETDFNSAVAVSPDGTKIVHADWVMVSGIGTLGSAHHDEKVRQRYLVFRGDQFQTHKALRPQGEEAFAHCFTNGRDILGEGRTADTMTPQEVATIGQQVETRRKNIRRCFFVPSDFDHALFIDCRLPRGTMTRIYMTAASFCPTPLPDGGIEVTV